MAYATFKTLNRLIVPNDLNHRRQARYGMTLIETLIGLGIVLALIGLCLAAVSNARAIAARASCASNIRQISQAMHNYHSMHQILPAGCSRQLQNEKSQPALSWHTRLLPEMSQQSLSDTARYALQQDPQHQLDNYHQEISKYSVPGYLCSIESRSVISVKNEITAMTSYQGIAGSHKRLNNGMLNRSRAVRFCEVSDGLSSTIMIGERPPGPGGARGGWYSTWGNNICGVGQIQATDPFEFLLPPQCSEHIMQPGPGAVSDPCSALRFWSLHPGGSHFACGDGSCRFLRYSGFVILPALATVAGAESIGDYQ